MILAWRAVPPTRLSRGLRYRKAFGAWFYAHMAASVFCSLSTVEFCIARSSLRRASWCPSLRERVFISEIEQDGQPRTNTVADLESFRFYAFGPLSYPLAYACFVHHACVCAVMYCVRVSLL